MQLFALVRVTFFTLRRTLAFWLMIAAPLFIVCFRSIAQFKETETSRYAWHIWNEANYSFWTGILLALTMALDIALLVDLDRSAQSWKYMFALPISRTSLYVAKLVVAAILMFGSGLILFVASLASGELLAIVLPSRGFALDTPDALYYLGAIVMETVAGLFIVAIFVWISMRTKNFILPLCIAIVGTVVNLVAYSSVEVQKFWPWMYALDADRILTITPQTEAYLGWPLPTLLAISVVGAICVTVLGCIEFSRRDIY